MLPSSTIHPPSSPPPPPVVQPKLPPRPDGFWSLNHGAEGGLQGTIAGVIAAIDAEADVPAHSKTALKEQLKSHLEDTDHNFVVIHAHSVCRDDEKSYHSTVTFDITSSKKNL